MADFLETLQVRLQDPAIPWQRVVIALGLGVNAFEGYIGSRQKPFLSATLHPTIPLSLQPYLSSETSQASYLKSQSYALAKMSYGSYIALMDQVESFLLLSSTALPLASLLFSVGKGASEQATLLSWFWDFAAKVPGGGSTEIRHSMAFVFVLTTLGTFISAPKAYYKNFVLEEAHGFNKTSRSTFVADQIKGYFLSVALELPIIAAVLWIIEYVGNAGMLRIVAYLMGFIVSLQLVIIPLYPYLIAPLFNTFTPLPKDSPVFPLVEALAKRLSFPLGRVWVMDGSRRSAHSNAFFFGLPGLTKHIVIYDTLIEKSTPEEIEAILAHELGHWKGNHVPILLATSLLQTAFSLSIFTLFLQNKPLLHAFGFPTAAASIYTSTGPKIISLLLAANLFSPLSAVLNFATNAITRTLEYDADRFAAKLGEKYVKGLKSGLVRIHEDNLAIYAVDPIYSAYHNNHPTLIERLEALDSYLDVDAKGTVEVKEGKKDL